MLLEICYLQRFTVMSNGYHGDGAPVGVGVERPAIGDDGPFAISGHRDVYAHDSSGRSPSTRGQRAGLSIDREYTQPTDPLRRLAAIGNEQQTAKGVAFDVQGQRGFD